MSTIANLYYESSISHHGIPGMKWGIRRYQNKDGSLTAKGRQHQQKQMERIVRKERTEQQKLAVENLRIQEQRKTAQAKAKLAEEKRQLAIETGKFKTDNRSIADKVGIKRPEKNVKDLSDEEIKSYLYRLDLEQKYMAAIAPPPKQKSAISSMISDVGTKVISDVAKDVLTKQLKNGFDKLLNSDTENNKKKTEEDAAKEQRDRETLEWRRNEIRRRYDIAAGLGSSSKKKK